MSLDKIQDTETECFLGPKTLFNGRKSVPDVMGKERISDQQIEKPSILSHLGPGERRRRVSLLWGV